MLHEAALREQRIELERTRDGLQEAEAQRAALQHHLERSQSAAQPGNGEATAAFCVYLYVLLKVVFRAF